jgi:hypothetical protein
MMRTSWRQRIAIGGGVWAAAVVLMTALDMDPDVALTAALAAVVVAVLCLLLDLSDHAVQPPRRPTGDVGTLHRGGDARLGMLQRQLQHAPINKDGSMLHRILVELVDDRLQAGSAIDRHERPAAASAAMGPDLTAFVESPPSPQQLGDAAFMSMILTRIEAL